MSDEKPIKLTPKQGAFLKAYLDPDSPTFGNGTLSVMKIYDVKDYQSAQVIASENLSKLKNPVKTLMEARGIGMDKLLVVLNNGLQAKKIITSPTEQDKEVADHGVRHKYLETAARWLGVESNNGESTPQQTNIQINFGRGE